MQQGTARRAADAPTIDRHFETLFAEYEKLAKRR
jgi:hypothetical protein